MTGPPASWKTAMANERYAAVRTAKARPEKTGTMICGRNRRPASRISDRIMIGHVFRSIMSMGIPQKEPVIRQLRGRVIKAMQSPFTAAFRCLPAVLERERGTAPVTAVPKKDATISPLYRPAAGSTAICFARYAPPASQLKRIPASSEGSQPADSSNGVTCGAI